MAHRTNICYTALMKTTYSIQKHPKLSHPYWNGWVLVEAEHCKTSSVAAHQQQGLSVPGEALRLPVSGTIFCSKAVTPWVFLQSGVPCQVMQYPLHQPNSCLQMKSATKKPEILRCRNSQSCRNKHSPPHITLCSNFLQNVWLKYQAKAPLMWKIKLISAQNSCKLQAFHSYYHPSHCSEHHVHFW